MAELQPVVNPIGMATAATPGTMTTPAAPTAVPVPAAGTFNAGTPAQVTTTANIAASANPAPAPDDLLGIRNQINSELGIGAAQSAYDAAYNALNAHDLGSTQLNSNIGNQAVAMNVIRGEQGVAAEQRAIQRQALAMTANVEANKLQALKQEAADRFAIKQQNIQEMKSLIVQYPGAGITFADSTETASKKIADWNKKEEKRLRKQAQKDAKKASKDEYKLWLKKTEKTNELSYKDWLKKGGGSSSKSEVTIDKSNKGISALVEEAVNSGADWGTIAATLKANGVNVSSGSYADKVLRYSFGMTDQKKNPLTGK